MLDLDSMDFSVKEVCVAGGCKVDYDLNFHITGDKIDIKHLEVVIGAAFCGFLKQKLIVMQQKG